MKKKEKKKPECPDCGSKNILTNKDGRRWCRICGHEWDKK